MITKQDLKEYRQAVEVISTAAEPIFYDLLINPEEYNNTWKYAAPRRINHAIELRRILDDLETMGNWIESQGLLGIDVCTGAREDDPDDQERAALDEMERGIFESEQPDRDRDDLPWDY